MPKDFINSKQVVRNGVLQHESSLNEKVEFFFVFWKLF